MYAFLPLCIDHSEFLIFLLWLSERFVIDTYTDMRELQQVRYTLLGTGFVLKVVGVKQEGTWEAVSWGCVQLHLERIALCTF